MTQPVQVEGSLFAGGRSERQAALLSVTDTGQFSILLAQSNRHIELPGASFAQLDISPRLGNTPRYISFADGSSFETADNDSIDRLQVTHQQGGAYRFIHRLESHLLLVLVIVVLVSGFVWASVKYAVPEVAKLSANILPVEVTRYLGQGTLDILDKTAFSPSGLDSARQQALSRLFSRYADDYPDLEISFVFRKGGDIGANAMALPDGHIVFTDELVNLAENDQELVTILGHEIGHLAHRHLLRRVIQDSMLTFLLVMVTGDVSSASSIIIAIPSVLLELAYSRDFEIEADDFAYDFVIDHRIDPQHFANIMQRIMSSHQLASDTGMKPQDDAASGDEDSLIKKAGPYLSTHPATRERIQKFITIDQAG